MNARLRPTTAPLVFHIERLVLEQWSLPARECARLRAAAEAELTRLLGAGALRPELRQGVALPSLRIGDIALRAGASPEAIGRQVARALHQGLCEPAPDAI